MRQVLKSEVRVVICGSNYGAMYALALSTLPGFRLTGIVARGSARSVNLAKKMGVPLFKSPSEITSPVDIAIVAVGGKAAKDLVLAFLRKGIHVLTEHPIGPRAVRAALTAARHSGACFHVNGHWGDLPPARAFVDECAQACRSSEPIFVSVQSSARLFYSAIDIVLRVLGPTDKLHRHNMVSMHVPRSTRKRSRDFRWNCTSGLLAGIPCVLQRSLWTSRYDDGNDFLVMHRISVTFADGRSILLGEASGPVIEFSKYTQDTRTLYTSTRPNRLPASIDDLKTEISSRAGPMWHDPIGAPPLTFADLLGNQRLEANQLALSRLWDQVTKGVISPEQSEQHLLATARIQWHLSVQMRGALAHYERALEKRLLRIGKAGIHFVGLDNRLAS